MGVCGKSFDLPKINFYFSSNFRTFISNDEDNCVYGKGRSKTGYRRNSTPVK